MRRMAAALVFLGLALLIVTAQPAISDGRRFFGLWQFRHFALTASLWAAGGAVFAASRSRRALFSYLYAGVLTVSMIVLLEIPGLAGWISYSMLMGNRREIPTNDLGATPVANVDVRGQTYMDTATSWGIAHEPLPFHYRTDQRGFRNSEDLDEADLYLIGDSIVVGALVPFEKSVAARLGELTGRTVMNVALIGVGPEEMQGYFRKAELPIAGRLVLQFIFEGNDLLDTAHFHSRKAGGEADSIPLRQRSFTYNAMLAVQRWSQPVVGMARRQSCTIDDQLYTFSWVGNSHRDLESQIPTMFTALEAFAREIASSGGHYAVVFVPTKLRVLRDICVWPVETTLRDPGHIGPLRDAILGWSTKTGVPVIDLTGVLQTAAATGEIPWFWGDTHWNATGHRIAAEALSVSAPVQDLLGQPQAAPDGPGESPDR